MCLTNDSAAWVKLSELAKIPGAASASAFHLHFIKAPPATNALDSRIAKHLDSTIRQLVSLDQYKHVEFLPAVLPIPARPSSSWRPAPTSTDSSSFANPSPPTRPSSPRHQLMLLRPKFLYPRRRTCDSPIEMSLFLSTTRRALCRKTSPSICAVSTLLG